MKIFIYYLFDLESIHTPPPNLFDQKLEQLQQKFQMQNQDDLNKIFNNKLASLEMNPNFNSSSDLAIHDHLNVINCNNDSLSESTSSSEDNMCENQKKSSYYDHDISDLELGYSKKQSCEYYDDVKRNLKFDYEDESQSDSENVNKNPLINSKKQDIIKTKTKNSFKQTQKQSNGTKSLNSSISTCASMNSIPNSSSSKHFIQTKVLKKTPPLTQNISINSQNRSMISLQMSPNHQTTGKPSASTKDISLVISGNSTNKAAIYKLSNSNKRIWK